ncbi:hypothetical protein RDWZM_005741 [Blomia tropicalis]|uniref:Protein KRI1 homolog n=1 Tax=Blomia tropicalis TaxID=40697 RepID=A0A9Q0M6T2_BLOTA|nr:hypothetical protein RDWZM_005741 [Blomia tropicalis]
MASDNPKLFDSDEDEANDNEPSVNILNNESSYAKKYNDWRRKEELQKLKDKYGDTLDIMSEIEDNEDDSNGNSDDSDESDSSNELSSDEMFEEKFLEVYSALKTKDPKIYNKEFNVAIGDDSDDESDSDSNSEKIQADKKSNKKDKKLTIPEYHRKLILEKKGITEEDEFIDVENRQNEKPTYHEELYNIRREIKDIVKNGHEEEEDDQLFSVKGNSISPKPKKYNSEEKERKLAELWNDPKKMDKSEQFLKDYIINKRYREHEPSDSDIKKLTSVDSHFGGFDKVEENISDGYEEDDDDNDDNQLNEDDEKKVHIANYHFEEPDANVIKRYPRSISSIRDTIKKDKKTKRAEGRERKNQEKEAELKRLRKLKREENESKIQKLKEVSGNNCIDIKDLDLNVIIDDDNDFDPEKYEQKMKLLFGDSYYNMDGDCDKPSFEYVPEIDDDLYGEERSNEDNLKNKKKNKKDIKQKRDIMADDDIGIFEDIIGGNIATRFRYRMVEPNDFGLTDEEILRADDQELNRWCSLKKMSQYRGNQAESYDKKVYAQKSKNMELKKKIFKSLFGTNDDEDGSKATNNEEPIKTATKKGKKRRNKKKVTSVNKPTEITVGTGDVNQMTSSETTESSEKAKRKTRKRKKASNVNTNESKPNDKQTNNETGNTKKRKRPAKKGKPINDNKVTTTTSDISIQRLKAYGLSNREIKRVKTK